jgi:hypothetical protein
MADEYDYSPEEKALMLINEQIGAESEEVQKTVDEVSARLYDIVESFETAGQLALARLCAEIDAGVK